MSQTETLNPTRDDFAEMLEASLVDRQNFEETVVKGTVTAIEKDVAVIDVGLKTEGRVPLKEFAATWKASRPFRRRSSRSVCRARIENALGEAVISREKARREEAWDRL